MINVYATRYSSFQYFFVFSNNSELVFYEDGYVTFFENYSPVDYQSNEQFLWDYEKII